MAFQLETGQVIDGKYEIINLLSEGGMGKVYLAYDRNIDREVVLKTLKLSSDEDLDEQALQSLLTRFQAEIRAVGRLDHPNIIAIYDSGRFSDMPYFIMNHFTGVTLRKWFDANRPTLKQFFAVINQILSALEHAHAQLILHRDIKRSNVLVRGPVEQPVVKLIDWGISIYQDSAKTRITNYGKSVGSMGHIDPAILKDPNANYTPQSDLYSLGVMMYDLLCGQLPVSIPSQYSTLSRQEMWIENEITTPNCVNPHLPDSVASLLLHLLKSIPSERPASARDVMIDIERICQELSDEQNVNFTVWPTSHVPSKISIEELLEDINQLEKPLIRKAAPDEITAAGQFQRPEQSTQIDKVIVDLGDQTKLVKIDPQLNTIQIPSHAESVQKEEIDEKSQIPSELKKFQQMAQGKGHYQSQHKWKIVAGCIGVLVLLLVVGLIDVSGKVNAAQREQQKQQVLAEIGPHISGDELADASPQEKPALDKVLIAQNKTQEEAAQKEQTAHQGIPSDTSLGTYNAKIQAKYPTAENMAVIESNSTTIHPEVNHQPKMGETDGRIKTPSPKRLSLDEQAEQLIANQQNRVVKIPYKTEVRAMLLHRIDTSSSKNGVEARLLENIIDQGKIVASRGDILKGIVAYDSEAVRARINFNQLVIRIEDKQHVIQAVALGSDGAQGLGGTLEFPEEDEPKSSGFVKETVKEGLGNALENIPIVGGIAGRTVKRAGEQAAQEIEGGKTVKPSKTERLIIKKDTEITVRFIAKN